ncbi:MAG: contractile injection system tape measure protein, partial [Bacteroidota bacterium]
RMKLGKIKNTPAHFRQLERTVYAPSPALEVLLFYLEKGSLPWWTPSDFVEHPVELFRQLVQNNPVGLKQILLSVMKSEWSRKRMVHDFTDFDLKQLVRLLEPINWETITSYNEGLAKQHEKFPVVKMERRDFRKLRWEIILKYLYEERGSEFNQRSFLKQILIDLARQFNIPYSELILQLGTIAEQFDAANRKEASLLKNILFLAKEETRLVEPPPERNWSSTERKVIGEWSPDLQKAAWAYLSFLNGVSQEWPSSNDHPTLGKQLIERLWTIDPDRASYLIQRLILLGDKARSTVLQLSPTMINEVLAKLYPEGTTRFWQYQKDWIQLLTLAGNEVADWSILKESFQWQQLQLLVWAGPKGRSNLSLWRPILQRLARQKEDSYERFVKKMLARLGELALKAELHSTLWVELQ